MLPFILPSYLFLFNTNYKVGLICYLRKTLISLFHPRAAVKPMIVETLSLVSPQLQTWLFHHRCYSVKLIESKQASKQEETGNSMSGMKNSEGIFARRYSIIKSRMNTLKTFSSKMVTLNILFLLIQLFFFLGMLRYFLCYKTFSQMRAVIL